ncbi:MAG TPA: hypothetical protein VNI35_00875, partial [Nitrospira sp.]|nr:hypothetical protein [Nitrospira sp.]
MLKLRELFAEDQQRLSQAEQQRRLQEAASILGSLRQTAGDSVRDQQESEPLAISESSTKRITPREPWTIRIRFAQGVGPKRTAVLQRLGIETVEDALWTVPWRYEDRSVMTPIGQLVPGMIASICGTIVKSEAKRTRHRRFS